MRVRSRRIAARARARARARRVGWAWARLCDRARLWVWVELAQLSKGVEVGIGEATDWVAVLCGKAGDGAEALLGTDSRLGRRFRRGRVHRHGRERAREDLRLVSAHLISRACEFKERPLVGILAAGLLPMAESRFLLKHGHRLAIS
eukprot:474188-Pleurochrysis_carterae.AAC.1